MMNDSDRSPEPADDELAAESRFNLENLFFAFLGAWCAIVVSLMAFSPSDSDSRFLSPLSQPLRDPATESTPNDYPYEDSQP